MKIIVNTILWFLRYFLFAIFVIAVTTNAELFTPFELLLLVITGVIGSILTDISYDINKLKNNKNENLER